MRLFAWHDAHPVTLFLVLLKRYGPDFLTWDAQALRESIVEDFKATGISFLNWQKIEAVRTVLLATSPWTEWEVFEKVVQALNNNEVDVEVVQHCPVSRLMVGVDIMGQLDSDPRIPDKMNPETPSWSAEVMGYIAACAVEDAVTFLPEPLDFAQHVLSEPRYVCPDCGNDDKNDLEDGVCDVCSGRFADEYPFNGQPAAGAPPDAGRNLRYYLKRDPAAVESTFRNWVDAGPPKGGVDLDDAIQLQAGKILVAHRYMLERRTQLQQQLESLKDWVAT